jgi:hypothetical protein
MFDKSEWDKNTLPHSDIIQLDERLWYITGSLPFGNTPRNMVIYRLDSGKLLIHSAVALKDEYMTKLEQMGVFEYMIVPNRFHRLDASLFKKRYRSIKVICPSAIREKVEQKVTVDNTVEDLAEELVIRYHVPVGFKTGELVYELNMTSDKALVFCDLLFNLDHLGGIDGWFLRLLGSTGFFGTTRVGRILMKDKPAIKKLLLKLSETDSLEFIIVAHGNPVTIDCSHKLKEAASIL